MWRWRFVVPSFLCRCFTSLLTFFLTDGKEENDNQDKSDAEKVEIEDGVEEEMYEEMAEETDNANN